ncbi:MAG TPA: alpha/beta hydrolase [Pyrinomonadaceae bacterium]|nr:alpha/beta hydrolase [Pyrinomonadaceae bacterium]
MTIIRQLAFACALLALIQATACAQKSSTARKPEPNRVAASETTPGAIFHDVPEKVDVKARYLFYLHGRIIEEKGIRPTDARFGVYEYEQILDALSREGFLVISEARAKGTDPKEYAQKVAGQIQTLLQKNVPPQNITVVGASKGAIITMIVSTALKNREVNFVIMSNCNDWVLENFDVDLYGNVLSIYDYKDEFGQTCRKIFDKASGLNRSKEIVLQLGTGHAVLYKPLREWIDPATQWAKGSLQ